MPPPRKKAKPHPRSLDALFPKPKVKRCARGHTQTPEWRPTRGCSTCRKQDDEAAERKRLAEGAAKAERETWSARLGPPPLIMELRTHDGTVRRFYPARGRRGRRR